MKNENYIEVKHLGLTIKVTRENDSRFIVPDYTTGKRVRHVRTSEAAAKEKAKEVCEILARGKVDDRIILTNDDLRYNIRKAMEAMATVGMEIRTGSELLVSALKIVPADELVDAVRFYKTNKPDRPLRRVTVNEGVADFKASHRAGAIREQNLSNYLEVFARNFGNRVIVDIEQTDIEKWFAGQEWSAKTYNDALQMTSQFWKHAIKSRCAVKNPVTEIKRLKVAHVPVKIYTPDALQKQLFNLRQKAPELVAVAAVGAFGGIRIREISRLDWTQLNQALQTGFIEMSGVQTKTGVSRYVPVSDNLKAWLLAYRKESGPIFPRRWLEKTKRHQDRLNELGRYIQKKTKVKWQSNGWRHSFGTYHFKLHGDPHATIKAMGTSIEKLDRYYMSKAQVVTQAMAAEWFNIYPEPIGQILLLHPQNENGTPLPCENAKGDLSHA
ncbi:MAG: site-specific integrase [Verrucomicrobiota bacterium]|jgi:integrase